MTVDEALKAMTFKTDKVATIEDMNDSIANAFKNWDDNSKDKPRYTLKELLAQTDYETVRAERNNESLKYPQQG